MDVIGWAEGVEEELMKMTAGLKAKCLHLTSVPSDVESYMCFSQCLLSVNFYMTNDVLICLLSYGDSNVWQDQCFS